MVVPQADFDSEIQKRPAEAHVDGILLEAKFMLLLPGLEERYILISKRGLDSDPDMLVEITAKSHTVTPALSFVMPVGLT